MTKSQDGSRDVAELLPALAALPRPQLPPEVAARLDAAIARAVAERAASGAAEPVPVPPEGSYGLRRRLPRFQLPRLRLPRLRLAALGAVAAGVVAILAVSLSLHQAGTPADTPAAIGGGSSGASALSTAQVTDPSLLSWAASALGQHAGPLVEHGNTTGQPQFGTSEAALSCLQAAPLASAAIAQRRLLSSVSGEYHGQPALLAAYTNGDDSATAFIVVFATPCRGANSTVLASGIVPK
jgi:hypothetical protein